MPVKYSPSKSGGNRWRRGYESVNILSSFEIESFDGIANETPRHLWPILSELGVSTKMFSNHLPLYLLTSYSPYQPIASTQPWITKNSILRVYSQIDFYRAYPIGRKIVWNYPTFSSISLLLER